MFVILLSARSLATCELHGSIYYLFIYTKTSPSTLDYSDIICKALMLHTCTVTTVHDSLMEMTEDHCLNVIVCLFTTSPNLAFLCPNLDYKRQSMSMSLHDRHQTHLSIML